MTFLSKIFGKKQVEAVATPVQDIIVPKDLFIEEKHPDEFKGSLLDKEEQTIIGDLQKLDYRALGKRDGYQMHDYGRMELQLELIAADFRQAFDAALQEVEVQLDILALHMKAQTEEFMPDIFTKLQKRYDQLEKQKRDLILQKDLALIGEGLVEKPFKLYKVGFHEGFDIYVQDELIFKHIKLI